MLHRRITAILALIFLIPPLLGASEVACPRHGENHAAPAAAPPMEGHAHHHQSQPQDTAPTERHPLSDCCPVMSTCSGVAIQVGESAFGFRPPRNDAPSGVVTLSRSRVESPDPPPPRV